MRNYLELCPCGSKRPATALYDGHNIFLTYACDRCRRKQIAKFRPDIFERYEAEEPIEED